MSDTEILESLSIQELRAELAARQARHKPVLTAAAITPLKHIDDATLVDYLRYRQKVIHGVDDRKDIYELPPDHPARMNADSVVALFNVGNVKDNGNGTSTLAVHTFGTAQNLCPAEPFRDQPTGAYCTGFLVAQDIVATAGHCVVNYTLLNMSFVFGFEMADSSTPRLVIDNSQIYRGAEIVGRAWSVGGPDWALVRLDRPVTDHLPLKVRAKGKIDDGQAVYAIGHPCGLPKKFADGATVRENDANWYFVVNTDTYAGSSGSPVFSVRDNMVEGILIRGETDFVRKGDCYVSLVCGDHECRGESCTRTTEFASLIL